MSAGPLPASGGRTFDYDTAFGRNLGLVSRAEQDQLRRCRIGLPGMGAVGGAHLQVLARMGVGAFHLADPDHYEVANLHRQVGATMATLGRPKVEVMAEVCRSINPGAAVETFPDGITPGNIDAFLTGIDVVVDGIEFFAIAARRMLYRACRARGIPVVNCGPVGYGAAVLVFTPDGPSFDDFFQIDDGMTRAEQLLAFGLGLTPGMIRDVDPRALDVENERGPALASAVFLCAATAGTEVLKLLTGRGRLSLASRAVYFDPLRGRAFPLTSAISLGRKTRGRALRWLAMRKFPAFQAMHERELAARRGEAEGAGGILAAVRARLGAALRAAPGGG
jgi:molybdopterin/thiamine biosynthesis adenylyltransferase